jgi:hypothetical protein
MMRRRSVVTVTTLLRPLRYEAETLGSAGNVGKDPRTVVIAR